jgi:hypothetical protein
VEGVYFIVEHFLTGAIGYIFVQVSSLAVNFNCLERFVTTPNFNLNLGLLAIVFLSV